MNWPPLERTAADLRQLQRELAGDEPTPLRRPLVVQISAAVVAAVDPWRPRPVAWLDPDWGDLLREIHALSARYLTGLPCQCAWCIRPLGGGQGRYHGLTAITGS